jgi:phage anti-repressor protein
MSIRIVECEEIYDEIRIITRYEEWYNLVEDSKSHNDYVISHSHNNEARKIIIVRLLLLTTTDRSIYILIRYYLWCRWIGNLVIVIFL